MCYLAVRYLRVIRIYFTLLYLAEYICMLFIGHQNCLTYRREHFSNIILMPHSS